MEPRTYAYPAIYSYDRHFGSFLLANVLPAIVTGPASFAGCQFDRTSGRTIPTPTGDLDPRLDQYASWGRGPRYPPAQYDTRQDPSTSEGRPPYWGSSHPTVQHPASQDASILYRRTVGPGGGPTCRADLHGLTPTTPTQISAAKKECTRSS